MPIGRTIRNLLGPLDRPIAELYRSFFMSVPRFMDRVRRVKPTADAILEIGCGEGAICERLARQYPTSQILGIDLTPRTGRLYRGPVGRVTFRVVAAEEVANQHAGEFDLIILGDVMHHVPPKDRVELLRQADRLLRADGVFILKDWEPIPNLGNLASHISDRYVSGEEVDFRFVADWIALLHEVFGENVTIEERRIPPWRNNFMLSLRRNPS